MIPLKGESEMPFNNDQFKFEIVKNITTLSSSRNGWVKEFNLVSFNDAPPKYDIRTWDPNHEKMGKGVTLNKEEIQILKDAINTLDDPDVN